MKIYSENQMQLIREEFESEILQRPHVITKKMFGCPCYKAKDNLFAFLVTEGIVLTKLSETERTEALTIPGAQFFEQNHRVVKKWIRIPLKDQNSLNSVMDLVTQSYENALKPEA